MHQARGRRKWEGLLSKEELERRYPDGRYRVIGEVSQSPSKGEKGAPMRMVGPENTLRGVRSPGSFDRSWHTVGYVVANEARREWIAVMGRRAPLAAILAVALIAAIGIAAWFILTPPPGGPDLEPGASRYEGGLARPEGSGPESILMPGYTDWEMAPNTTALKVPLINAEGNPCYMKFTVSLADTDETLFESRLVQPGDAVSDWNLARALAEGEYVIKIKIDTYSLDDHTQQLNGAVVGTRLIVR